MRRVDEWMTPDPVTVTPGETIEDARSLLRHYGIRHLPVVDDRGRVLGVVSDRDVRVDDERLRRLAHLPEVAEALGTERLVEDVMSSPPHVTGPDTSVDDAARLMMSHRIHALPVVDEGRLVGVLTTTDCLLSSLSPRTAAS